MTVTLNAARLAAGTDAAQVRCSGYGPLRSLVRGRRQEPGNRFRGGALPDKPMLFVSVPSEDGFTMLVSLFAVPRRAAVMEERTKGYTVYFTITKDRDGYRGRAYGNNHELVWWTEGYTTKASAVNAMRMLQNGAATAPLYDRT